jgi:hypothetical protein
MEEYLPQSKAWLRKGAELFSKHFETAHRLRITVSDAERRQSHVRDQNVVITLTVQVRTIAEPDSTHPKDAHLTQLESAILRHATLPAKQLAKLMGRKLNSYFRDVLRSLCKPCLLLQMGGRRL